MYLSKRRHNERGREDWERVEGAGEKRARKPTKDACWGCHNQVPQKSVFAQM